MDFANDNSFAYVSFVNNNDTYINLLKSTVKSVEAFSKYPIIVYCVDIPPENNPFTESNKCIVRNVSIASIQHKHIFYMKPYVIIDAIEKGLKSGFYLDADTLLTPHGDSIVSAVNSLDIYPISPKHSERDVIVPQSYMEHLKVYEKTQHYIHAANLLFKYTNLTFLKEWLENCLISEGEDGDETVLNCMYWKHGLKNHYLDVINPSYQNFYGDFSIIDRVITLHGCKNPEEQSYILHRMIEYTF